MAVNTGTGRPGQVREALPAYLWSQINEKMGLLLVAGTMSVLATSDAADIGSQAASALVAAKRMLPATRIQHDMTNAQNMITITYWTLNCLIGMEIDQ